LGYSIVPAHKRADEFTQEEGSTEFLAVKPFRFDLNTIELI